MNGPATINKNKDLYSPQLILHVLGCMAFVAVPFITWMGVSRPGYLMKNPLLWRDVATHILLTAFFYLHVYRIIPRIFFRQRYGLYILTIVAALAITIVLPAVIPAWLHQGPPPGLAHRPGFGPPHHGLLQRLLFNHLLYIFLFVFLFSLVLAISNRSKTIRQEKIQTELLFLKAQINPHFLFNTLNGVYSLCLDEKATQSAEAVLKVSGMMRYVLIDSKQDFVDIEKEIDYVKSYIDLQRLRFGNTVTINFELNGWFTHKKIAPLLLIPFIENAFKYGVNPESDSTVLIHLTIQENELGMQVENQKVAPTGNDQQMGIGIPNTLKRLELLYPGRHLVRTDQTGGFYRVFLSLQLT